MRSDRASFAFANSVARSLTRLRRFRRSWVNKDLPLKGHCDSHSAPTKPRSDRDLTRGGEVDFLEHCSIAKCVLIGSSNYFAAGPKRSASSFHEAMILAFVFRAL